MNLSDYIKTSVYKDILIVRTAPINIVEDIISTINNNSFNHRISAIIQKSMIDHFEKIKYFDFIEPSDDGIFKLWHIDMSVLNRLKEKKFDLIIIPYNNTSGKGYLHWELFSLLIDKNIIGCNKELYITNVTSSLCLKRLFADIIWDEFILKIFGIIIFPLLVIIAFIEPFVLAIINLIFYINDISE